MYVGLLDVRPLSRFLSENSESKYKYHEMFLKNPSHGVDFKLYAAPIVYKNERTQHEWHEKLDRNPE